MEVSKEMRYKAYTKPMALGTEGNREYTMATRVLGTIVRVMRTDMIDVGS